MIIALHPYSGDCKKAEKFPEFGQDGYAKLTRRLSLLADGQLFEIGASRLSRFGKPAVGRAFWRHGRADGPAFLGKGRGLRPGHWAGRASLRSAAPPDVRPSAWPKAGVLGADSSFIRQKYQLFND
jgi:hypothetical protein